MPCSSVGRCVLPGHSFMLGLLDRKRRVTASGENSNDPMIRKVHFVHGGCTNEQLQFTTDKDVYDIIIATPLQYTSASTPGPHPHLVRQHHPLTDHIRLHYAGTHPHFDKYASTSLSLVTRIGLPNCTM